MKPIFKTLILMLWISQIPAYAQNAKEIVRKANELIRAKSSFSELTLEVIKPDWSRKMRMKAWALEPDYSLILITQPAKDRGTVTLKRKKEVWNWVPSIHRVIKIPPSMMLQSWMGSDFTNDDLVRESSIVEDYTHSIIGSEKYGGYVCYKIRLLPKPEAGVVWGKIISFISKKGYMELRADYYDEDGLLIKSMLGSKVKKMGGRILPTHWEMVPRDRPGQKTVMDYLSIKFNLHLKASFFSIKNMKRIH